MSDNNGKSDLIPTSVGLRSVEEILDICVYTNYAANRDRGASAEQMARYFSGASAYEERYKRERAEDAASTRHVCGRCGGKHAGGCSLGYEAIDQDEQHRIRDGARY